MKINSIKNNPSFGMNLHSDSSFWINIENQIFNEPNSKSSKKLLKQIKKIEKYPLKDTYEIQNIKLSYVKNIENNPFKIAKVILQEGFKLVNKATDKTVLEKTSEQILRKNYTPSVSSQDFISYIAKNLKKLAKLEKIKG